MKTFYNVVNSVICCAKEARASIVLDNEWVQFVLQNCGKLQKYRFLKIGQKRAKSVRGLYKKNTCILRILHVVLCISDVMYKKYKRLVYTPPDLLARFYKVNLSNTWNPGWFFILVSLLDKVVKGVNWLPPRTILSYNRPL